MGLKLGRIIGVILTLVVLLTASGLHYTHDLAHHHHDCFADHQQEDSEPNDCSLCWFVLHQISYDFSHVDLLPDITVKTCVNLPYALFTMPCQDGVKRLLRNKDPPSFI